MLRAVEIKDICFEWDRVREGLVEVKKATTDDWLPEDVYMSLMSHGASLHIGENEQGDYVGFLVLQLVPTFHGKKLDIWAAYSATKKPLMRQFWPEIIALGQSAGANKITFRSKRDEWLIAAPKLGFVPGQTIYEHTL